MGTKKCGVKSESCFVPGGSPRKGVTATDAVWNRCDDPMVTRSDSAQCRTLKMAPFRQDTEGVHQDTRNVGLQSESDSSRKALPESGMARPKTMEV